MSDSLELRPEFSHRVRPQEIGPGPHEYRLRPDRDQRAGLARRFDLISIDRLEATVEICRQPNGDVLATGQLEAEVVQRCVVTLEPFKNTVATGVRRRYVAGSDPDMGIDEDEDTEPLAANLDIGELIAEEFGLALDPFPRAAGASLDETLTVAPEDSPFAILRRPKR